MTEDDVDEPANPPRIRAVIGALAVVVALGAIMASSLVTRSPSADDPSFCSLEGIVGPAVQSADYGMVIVVDAAEQDAILDGCPHGWGDVSLTPDCRLWDRSTYVGTVDAVRCAQLKAQAR